MVISWIRVGQKIRCIMIVLTLDLTMHFLRFSERVKAKMGPGTNSLFGLLMNRMQSALE